MRGNGARDRGEHGIGAAVARAFAEQGAKVAIHYNSSTKPAEDLAAAITAAGGTAVLVKGDLTKRGEPARVVAEAHRGLAGWIFSSTTPARW